MVVIKSIWGAWKIFWEGRQSGFGIDTYKIKVLAFHYESWACSDVQSKDEANSREDQKLSHVDRCWCHLSYFFC